MSKKSKSGKGGRRGWTTDEQREFLTSYLPSYLQAKGQLGNKSFEAFWPPLYEEWFKQWPLPELSEDLADGKTNAPMLAAKKLVSNLC